MNAFSAVFLNGNFGRNDWYVDSGASVHLTPNRHWMKNMSHDHSMKRIVVANQGKIPVECRGDVQITTLTNTCEYEIVVEDVLYVPSLTTNLLSVSQFISKGNRVLFSNEGCQIFNEAGDIVDTACLVNRGSQTEIARELVSSSDGVRKRNPPERYGSTNACVSNEKDNLEDAGELTLEVALRGPKRQQWLEVVQKELE
ncbi:hypothetical protein JTB14_011873 [Gonioctena quinquepunctata]|nr:hypothetical protein JTB14_011873 [Gonioctena quinquepunctata]